MFTDQVKEGDGDGDGVGVEDSPGAGNMHFIQMTFEGPFSLTFAYRASDATLLEGMLTTCER